MTLIICPDPGIQWPTEGELKVLRVMTKLWADRRDSYGPTSQDIQSKFQRGHVTEEWEEMTPATIRGHLSRLNRKKLAWKIDRREVGGELTWQPLRAGRLLVYEQDFPIYAKHPRPRMEVR